MSMGRNGIALPFNRDGMTSNRYMELYMKKGGTLKVVLCDSRGCCDDVHMRVAVDGNGWKYTYSYRYVLYISLSTQRRDVWTHQNAFRT